MLEFKKPELSDKSWVDECLKHAASMSCEYTFGNTYIWADSYNSEICKYKDFFICRWGTGDDISYSLPLGEGDFTDAVNQIIADAENNGVKPVIYGVTAGYLVLLQEAFTGKFTYSFDDGLNDYIYKTDKMASLGGKKYHSKRNHVTNFKKNNPDWCFEKIDDSNIAECIALHMKWLNDKDDEANADYADEFEAVLSAFLPPPSGLSPPQDVLLPYGRL